MGVLIFIILLALYLYGIKAAQQNSNIEIPEEDKCPPHSWYREDNGEGSLRCKKCKYYAGKE